MLNLRETHDLERLASGECTITEENDALVQCEANPELYRDVATSLVEYRQLSRALRHFSECNPDIPTATKPVTQSDRPASRRWTALSLAAVLVLSMGASFLSFQAGKRRIVPAEPARASLSERPVVVYVQYPASTPQIQPDQSHEWSNLPRPLLTSRAHQLLRNAGLDVKEEYAMHLMDGSDGASSAVPARQLKVNYVAP